MDQFLTTAFQEAEKGYKEGGIPIGSALVCNGQVLSQGHNQRVQKGSVVLHGEMDALENAGRQSAGIYAQCTLYTTLSPCSMCAGTIILYGIPKVVIGENQNLKGEEELLQSKGVEVVVVNDDACSSLMRQFIQENPVLWNEDIGKV